VARFTVDVHLEELVLVQETPPRFVDEKVIRVLLRDQVRVVAMAQRGSDLDCLSGQLEDKNRSQDWTNCGNRYQYKTLFSLKLTASQNESLFEDKLEIDLSNLKREIRLCSANLLSYGVHVTPFSFPAALS
jgi:hypothetical protein